MRPASHHRWARTFAASAVVAIGCSSGPTLPPTDTGPTGTLLVEGSITVGPGGGLLTIRLSDTLITPIASDVYGFVSRLSPDGTTAYAFSFPTPQDVFRLVASRRPGEAVSLLEFQWPASTPVGLAVDGSGERIAFIEGNYGQGLATVRLHRLGRVGWTDLLTYTGELADLDWHRDGRRLVTTASARVTTPDVGRIAIIDVEAKTVTPITPPIERLLSGAVFAPDGRSIVYSRINASGNVELASIGFDGGRATTLPAQLDGGSPVFSPDGKYLAYCDPVPVGNNRFRARFIRRLADGVTV